MSAPFRNVLRLELDLEAFADEGRVDWDAMVESVNEALHRAAGLYSFQTRFTVDHEGEPVGMLTIDTERAE